MTRSKSEGSITTKAIPGFGGSSFKNRLSDSSPSGDVPIPTMRNREGLLSAVLEADTDSEFTQTSSPPECCNARKTRFFRPSFSSKHYSIPSLCCISSGNGKKRLQLLE